MSTAESTALARIEPGTLARSDEFLMPAVPVAQMIARRNAMVEVAKALMVEGLDYGVIPGTGGGGRDGEPNNKKNVLLKPGAEKLCTLFGLTAEYEDYRVTENWEAGFFYYAFRCLLKRGDRTVGTGIGSANSREKKWRRTSKACPECGQPTIKRSKHAPQGGGEPGWYCYAKIGGCGMQFAADDASITQQADKVNPDEACDLVNTILKMSQKRAFVAAVLQATNASEFFTQDVEDMEVIEAEWKPAAEQPRPQQQQQQQQQQTAHEMADDALFLKAVHAAAMSRGITPSEADAGLATTKANLKNAADYSAVAWRLTLIGGINAGKADKWKTPAAAPAPQPTPDDAAQPPTTTAKLTGEQRLELHRAVASGAFDWSTGAIREPAAAGA
jgi:alpha-D-ribose 1-methylphosphonate 5-triphosphate synthase subunit PhnG